MDDERILDRLRELDIELPPPPPAIAAYLPCVVHGSLAFVAGQIAMNDGVVLHPGSLGERVSLDEGVDAARRAALQALSALRDALGGSFERLERILQVTVFVASVPSFVDHPKVANGASEFVAEILGDSGRHARAAVGVPSLPLGAPVELVMTAAVRSA
ncbi:MAG: RidA family protein [Actinobacteria bacterium]|nr:MAG: RidA family protein [Actinomycetota bacterium]